MKIIEKKTSELIPYARNPRKNDDAVNSVAASIKEFGFKQPIVIDAEGVVVAGHTRLKAAQKLGLETVPCVVASDLTPAQIKAYRLLDNKVAEKADWDFALLQVEIEDLADFDLEPFDVDWELPIDTTPLEGGAAAPAPPEVAFSKSGDLWLLGRHRLLCGDSTSPVDVTRLMDGELCGLMNTDPPYGVDYVAIKNGIPASGMQNISERCGDIVNDDLLDSAKLQEFLENAIRAILPHLTENPAFYLWHIMSERGQLCVAAAAATAAADILIHRQIIWVKPSMVLTRSGMYHWRHELCAYGWIRGKQPPWYGAKNQTSVWELGRENDTVHPTEKPTELFAIPMRNHTREGEVVYEPFGGSGSQFIAAHKLNRRCYGLEISPRYVDVICQRFYNETGIIPVKEDGTKFPVDRNGLKEKSVKDTQAQE